MRSYKLLTPGPLTTTETVKQQMLFDHCTWDDDYKQITQQIRRGLLDLEHVSPEEYTAVLMQGSGTFGVESVLTSIPGANDELLICANGAYGERMTDIAEHAGIKYQVYNEHYNKVPNAQKIGEMLDADPAITHVAMVHSETTSGILNDIEAVGKVVKEKGRIFIVDAMSSFGGVDIPVKDWGIDFIISSANKCIQGVPGFSFIIARKDLLEASAGNARSLSLDLYDQWKTMEEVREPMGMLKIDHIRTMLKMGRIRNFWIEKYGKEPEEEDAQKLYAIFEEKLLSILHLYSDPKPGVVDVVNKLRRNGYKIGSTTGYNDKMMEIVVPAAKEKGYEPDVWFSPDSTGQKGRPYPYMIFRNMEALDIKKVRRVLKVGDTISDIKEGRNAGVWSAGIVVGSSEMGLSLEEYEALSKEEKDRKCDEVAQKFIEAGADKVFYTIEDLAEYLLG